MKILDFGSLNFDKVYSLDHLVEPGETITSKDYNCFFGGKGLNQAVALARSGAEVAMAGSIGEDGEAFLKLCEENGIDSSKLQRVPGQSGHAIIQVSGKGENAIILFGGSNVKNTREYVDSVLLDFEPGDYILLQNEINLLDYVIDKAYERGMKIVLNPSPFNDALKSCDLRKISLFMLNEVEGGQITGETEPDRILDELSRLFPEAELVLTLGKKGSIYMKGKHRYVCRCVETVAVDTTAAGDTFTGYFIGGLYKGMTPEQAMDRASKASAISVCRAGAIPSIPYANEVDG